MKATCNYSFISPEGVTNISPERMLGGDVDDGLPLEEATGAVMVASFRGRLPRIAPPHWRGGLYK